MTQVRMRFDAALDAFLPPARRRVEFAYDAAQRATAKHAIEALGVPHTEVGTVRVDTRPVALDHLLRDGERLHVGAVPPAAAPPEDPRFVADAHLGRLARHLRFLGFDTLQRNAWDDAALVALAHAERRVVLTRERALLDAPRRRVRLLRARDRAASAAARGVRALRSGRTRRPRAALPAVQHRDRRHSMRWAPPRIRISLAVA
jgi:hypothetical protein